MEANYVPMPNYLIENGLELRNLEKHGRPIEIHSDYQGIDENDSDQGLIMDTLGHPIEVSFEELAKDMITVDEYGDVKKKNIEEGGGEIIEEACLVGIGYSAYWEWGKKPFDFRSPTKPLEFDMRDSVLLPGLYTAVASMRVGEVSLFLLSYRVMYGKMGNPPEIKPESDCVFYIKLVRSLLKSDIKANLSEINMFGRNLEECKKLFMNGSHFFKHSNVPMAIRCFKRAVHIMNHTRLADEEEEKRQEKFLLKLYLNLATCYNHAKNPRRACSMCNEINRLQNIWGNGKALYQNAKALRMLGEFKEAEKKLKKAKQLCPDLHEEIDKEYNTLTVQRNAYNESSPLFDQHEDRLRSGTLTEEFKMEATAILEQFKNDENICKIAFPKTLNPTELKYIEELSQKLKLNCSVTKRDASIEKTLAKE